MALPKIEHPTFGLTIPSTQEEIKYRPFLVREEKILLMAQESGDPDQFITAISQVLNNCVYDYDVSNLTSFDTEFLFIKLRANSVSDLAKISIYDEEADKQVELEIDLNLVECIGEEDNNSLLKLNDDISFEMRYPKYDDLKNIESSGMETSIEMITKCIGKIYNGEETLELADYSTEEQEEFINSFPSDSFAGIQKFFEKMPKVKLEVSYKVKIDGKTKTKKRVLEGINDFFS
tara:strand:- start:30 stop:731 length:702 start_codon:yes stop_codon:yes gene_type:complete